MHTKYILIVLTIFGATAVAQTDPSPSPMPVERTEPAFETAGLVETKLFLPEDVMKGRLHIVHQQAENDGLLNTYFLSSEGRDFEVTTGIALRARIREIYALNKLRGMSKTDEFGKAMANAGKKKLQSAGGIVRDPVGTIKRVPKGAH